MKKTLFFLILLLSLKLVAQQEITAKDIYNHIAFLASDSLKGRYPGTPESKVAAAYILDEFKKAGLKPMFGNGFQVFTIDDGVKIKSKQLKIDGFLAKFYEQYKVLNFSPSGKFEGKAVFVGYGFNVKFGKNEWNDYKNVDVKGKWAVILRGKPKVKDYPKTFFDRGSKEYEKVLEAENNGAIGVIFVNDYETNPADDFVKNCKNRMAIKSGIPAFSVNRTLANMILKRAGKDVRFVENEIITKNQPFSFEIAVDIKAKLQIEPVYVKTQNVVAYLEGTDPVLKNEYIVIGGHYDHLGFGGCGSGSMMPDTIAIHNGADDNASGATGVMELAKYLSAHRNELKRSIIFVTFGAEERGLLGSKYFVEHLPVPKDKIIAMLNMDMIGKSDGKLEIMGTGTATEFEDILKNVKNNSKDMQVKFSKEAFSSSDHASFEEDSIPVLFFYASTAKGYHTPFDDIDEINAKGEKDVLDYVAEVTKVLANYDGHLTYVKIRPQGSNGHKYSMKVRLGIVPTFGESEIVGVKISDVVEGGIAETSGFKAGDIIKEINGEPVRNIYDYMARMGKLNPGDKATIKITRNGETKVIEVQF